MGKVKKGWLIVLPVAAVIITAFIYLSRVSIPVLQPRGPIADQEFRLIIEVTCIMLIVVIPVFILLWYIVWKYRDDSPRRGKYQPDWDHNSLIEAVWWLIPTIIIVVLAVINWNSTYALNPYKPIDISKPALNVQVISLDWKWLFIYPKQQVASVNELIIPAKTPIHFYLTSDAPMNSFWIPQLSGQIYTMAGMQTQLYLLADQPGSYVGRSANISGAGFASMMFTTKAEPAAAFAAWVNSARSYSPVLSLKAYNQLAEPSSYVPPALFSRPASGLFNDVINKYLEPGGYAS